MAKLYLSAPDCTEWCRLQIVGAVAKYVALKRLLLMSSCFSIEWDDLISDNPPISSPTSTALSDPQQAQLPEDLAAVEATV